MKRPVSKMKNTVCHHSQTHIKVVSLRNDTDSAASSGANLCTTCENNKLGQPSGSTYIKTLLIWIWRDCKKIWIVRVLKNEQNTQKRRKVWKSMPQMRFSFFKLVYDSVFPKWYLDAKRISDNSVTSALKFSADTINVGLHQQVQCEIVLRKHRRLSHPRDQCTRHNADTHVSPHLC